MAHLLTQSLLNKYEVSYKSPEAPVKRWLKVVRKEMALVLNAPWDSIAMAEEYTRWYTLVYF